MIDKPFFQQFPQPLPRDPNSLFRQWVQAHQQSFNDRDEALEQVSVSYLITQADGDNLDRIGDSFGRLGRRRGRGDSQYRAFLLSIVPSFQGRGTRSGLKFAIGAGVRATPDDVYIEEFFDETAYSVEVGDWIAHDVTTIHELADLADPAGVNLRTPVKYRYERSGIGLNVRNTQRKQAITSPPAGIGLAASDSTVVIQGGGFGTGRFDGEDPFGERESDDGSGDSQSPSGGSAGLSSYGAASFGGRIDDDEDF